MAKNGSRRRSGRERREVGAFGQLPWRNLRNPYRPIEVLEEGQVEAIHDASLRILEEIGMDFLHPEALEILAKEPVDLIVSDVNMPRLDGIELAKVVREDRGLKVPILLLTSRCDQSAIAKALKPYDIKLHAKPFMPSRLVAEIDRLLGALTT